MHIVFAIKPHGYVDMTKALIGDVEKAIQALGDLRSGFDQFWARTLVRSFFALVEACTHELKNVVLQAAANGVITLSDGERAVLSDVTFDVSSDGSILERPRFVPIERHLRLLHTLMDRLFGSDAALPVSDHRFGKFKASIHIRNRITHPKSIDDTSLSNSEVETVMLAASWYGDVQRTLLARWYAIVNRA